MINRYGLLNGRMVIEDEGPYVRTDDHCKALYDAMVLMKNAQSIMERMAEENHALELKVSVLEYLTEKEITMYTGAERSKQ